MDDTRQLGPAPGETVADFKQRLAEREAEAVERRRRDLAEQNSASNSPSTRIRMWERLHQVALPRKPSHPVLQLIATGTGLTLDEVRAEQRERFPAESKQTS